MNLVLDESSVQELKFYGHLINQVIEGDISISSKISKLMELELAMSNSNIRYGTNQQIISSFSTKSNKLEFNSYFYSQKNYRLLISESEFMIRPDDNKHEIIKHQMKLAFMYPFRQKVKHFNTNQVSISE